MDKRETELKFRVSDDSVLRSKLTALNARYEGKFHEENYFCDDATASLAASDRILRLRRSTEAGSGMVEERLTYKEPLPDARFKVRRELELKISDLDSLRVIFEQLGFQCRPGYSKEREFWRLGELAITIDKLAFGRFVELEGSAEEIIRVAGLLGFDMADGISKSYLSLAEEAASENC